MPGSNANQPNASMDPMTQRLQERPARDEIVRDAPETETISSEPIKKMQSDISNETLATSYWRFAASMEPFSAESHRGIPPWLLALVDARSGERWGINRTTSMRKDTTAAARDLESVTQQPVPDATDGTGSAESFLTRLQTQELRVWENLESKAGTHRAKMLEVAREAGNAIKRMPSELESLALWTARHMVGWMGRMDDALAEVISLRAAADSISDRHSHRSLLYACAAYHQALLAAERRAQAGASPSEWPALAGHAEACSNNQAVALARFVRVGRTGERADLQGRAEALHFQLNRVAHAFNIAEEAPPTPLMLESLGALLAEAGMVSDKSAGESDDRKQALYAAQALDAWIRTEVDETELRMGLARVMAYAYGGAIRTSLNLRDRSASAYYNGAIESSRLNKDAWSSRFIRALLNLQGMLCAYELNDWRLDAGAGLKEAMQCGVNAAGTLTDIVNKVPAIARIQRSKVAELTLHSMALCHMGRANSFELARGAFGRLRVSAKELEIEEDQVVHAQLLAVENLRSLLTGLRRAATEEFHAQLQWPVDGQTSTALGDATDERDLAQRSLVLVRTWLRLWLAAMGGALEHPSGTTLSRAEADDAVRRGQEQFVVAWRKRTEKMRNPVQALTDLFDTEADGVKLRDAGPLVWAGEVGAKEWEEIRRDLSAPCPSLVDAVAEGATLFLNGRLDELGRAPSQEDPSHLRPPITAEAGKERP